MAQEKTDMTMDKTENRELWNKIFNWTGYTWSTLESLAVPAARWRYYQDYLTRGRWSQDILLHSTLAAKVWSACRVKASDKILWWRSSSVRERESGGEEMSSIVPGQTAVCGVQICCTASVLPVLPPMYTLHNGGWRHHRRILWSEVFTCRQIRLLQIEWLPVWPESRRV